MVHCNLTPQSFVCVARVVLLPLVALAGAAMVGNAPLHASVVLAFLVALVLLAAFPTRRHGDLLAGMMIAVTGVEWCLAIGTAYFDVTRWSYEIAIAGGMSFVLRINHLRGLARQDPYVSLRQLDQRNAVLARTRRSSHGTGTGLLLPQLQKAPARPGRVSSRRA